ncbi:hypothetical protein BOQ00_03425 [Campylobacter coli]|nr:hypothetical protein BOQ00_03425 [Campylobacter coli]
MNDTIAVILATYNGEKYLKQQIESILDQTYKNIKIYIGDDCSKDGTIDIIRAYKNLYPDKITYYQNETNIGFVKNFEKLLQNAKEDYIAFSDQDDVWLPSKLEEQINKIKEIEKKSNLPIMCHSDLIMIDENQKILCNSFFSFKKYKLKPEKDLGHILGPCGVMGNTMMINRALKDIILPFPEGIDFHDYYIAVICELFGKRVTFYEPFVLYRIHQDNTSNSKKNILSKKNNLLPYENKDISWLSIRKGYDKNDEKIIRFFIDYSEVSKKTLYFYKKLCEYDLVKRDLFYRMKLLLRFVKNRLCI